LWESFTRRLKWQPEALVPNKAYVFFAKAPFARGLCCQKSVRSKLFTSDEGYLLGKLFTSDEGYLLGKNAYRAFGPTIYRVSFPCHDNSFLLQRPLRRSLTGTSYGSHSPD